MNKKQLKAIAKEAAHAESDKDHIKIISARKADRTETKQYYEGLSYE